MKLSKKSWHYKLYMKFSKEAPNNLCTYFWSYVGMSLMTMLLGGLGICILIGMVYTGVNVTHLKRLNDNNPFTMGGEVGWILISAVIVVGGLSLIFKKDSLLMKYIKALIGKYCPKIDWE